MVMAKVLTALESVDLPGMELAVPEAAYLDDGSSLRSCQPASHMQAGPWLLIHDGSQSTTIAEHPPQRRVLTLDPNFGAARSSGSKSAPGSGSRSSSEGWRGLVECRV